MCLYTLNALKKIVIHIAPLCQKVITDGVKQDQFMYIQEGIENDCENEKKLNVINVTIKE